MPSWSPSLADLAPLAIALVAAGCVSDPPQITQCVLGATECAGACVDLSFNPDHCGACGRPCAPGESCLAGACACAGDVCGEECVDVASHPDHCGACDQPCEPGRYCDQGTCRATCGDGLESCDDRCVDTMTDREHCGACEASCPAGASCNAGSCACRDGLATCGEACVDTARDAEHCGACDAACRSDELCSGECRLACGPVACAPGGVAWGRRLAAPDASLELTAVSVDGAGDSWVTGTFSGGLDLGDGVSVTAAGTDLFVARFDPRGRPRWVRAFGAAGAIQEPGSLALVDGGVVVVGAMSGTVSFGNEMLTAQGVDVVVVRLDADGEVKSASRFGGANAQRATAVAPLGDGLVIGGRFTGQLVHDDTLTSDGGGDTDGFVLALDAAGALSWSAVVSDATNTPQGVVAVSTSGAEVAVTATSSGPASFGGQTFGGGGGDDAAVALFSAGAMVWLAELDGGGPDALTDVEALGGGKAAVVGDFTGTSTLRASGCPPVPVTSAGATDGLVVELDATGCRLWHHVLGGPGADRIASTARLSDGLLVAGHFTTSLSSSGVQLLATTLAEDGFVARVTESEVSWALRFGAAACDHRLCAIAADPATERLVVAGSYAGTVTFGSPLASATGLDGFLAAFGR